MSNLKRKIKSWFEKPYQCNSFILFCFIDLTKGQNSSVSYTRLKNKTRLLNFDDRFHSLKSDTGHNDGKIFVNTEAGFIKLNDDDGLAEFILQEYHNKFGGNFR